MRLGRGFAILACGLFGFLHAENSRPVVVDDTTQLRQYLLPENPYDSIPVGTWSIVPAGDTTGTLILFFNGTEYKRLPAEETDRLLALDSNLFAKQLSSRAESWRPALQSPTPNWSWIKSESMDHLDGNWFQQHEGLEVGKGMLSSRAERWWIRGMTWARASLIKDDMRAAVGITAYTDYMNMQREIRAFYGKKNFDDYSLDFSLTWKGITYELQQTPWVLPEYFWLEKSPDSLFLQAYHGQTDLASGDVISIFGNGVTKSNWSQSLKFRLWYARVQLVFDQDLYASTMYRLGMEDMPASFGHWGAFAVGCGGHWAPGFWLELGPWGNFQIPYIPRWDHFRIRPFHFEMAYQESTHFRIGMSTSIELGGSDGH